MREAPAELDLEIPLRSVVVWSDHAQRQLEGKPLCKDEIELGTIERVEQFGDSLFVKVELNVAGEDWLQASLTHEGIFLKAVQ